MPDDHMIDTLTDIRERLARLETKIDGVTGLREQTDKSSEIAKEAKRQAEAAHRRLDRQMDNQVWLWRTVAAAIITAVGGLLMNTIGHL